jgi:hypothetical protein
MSTHRCTALLILALSLVATGCDHPTAPGARDVVEKATAQLASGDYMQLEAGMSTLFDMASYYGTGAGGGRYVPSIHVPIVRDALHEPYRATVIERVYLPPEGSGARPHTRFTILAWTGDDTARSRKFVAMSSSDTVSPLEIPRPANFVEGAAPLTRSKPGMVLAADQADRRAWYGTEGTLRIEVRERTGGCPYEGMARHYSAIPDLQDTTVKMLCETWSYDATMSAFLERGDPSRRDVMTRINPLRGTLRLPRVTVPGVRLVTKCVGMPTDPRGCWERWAFWRSNDQFAESLRIDLDKFKTQPEGDLMEVADSGSGPDYRMVLGGYDPPLRYTVWTWDGRRVRDVARTTGQSDPLMQSYAYRLPQRVGARYRILVHAPGLVPGAPPYSMALLEITFLPHVPGVFSERSAPDAVGRLSLEPPEVER